MMFDEAALKRPKPPKRVLEALGSDTFVPCPDLAEWAYETFIAEGATLENPTHKHLREAHIGFLWTNCPNSRHGNDITGFAEIPNAQGGKWLKARHDMQLREWFGNKPDFLITLFAPQVAELDQATFCAIVEHELMHCGQDKDIWGQPRFRKSGAPVFCIRGHDVEEFCEITERYGAGASAGKTAELVRVANAGPTIARAQIDFACGSCMR